MKMDKRYTDRKNITNYRREMKDVIEATNKFLTDRGINDFFVSTDMNKICLTYTLKFNSISKAEFKELRNMLSEMGHRTTTKDVCINYLKELCFTFAIVRKQFYPA